MLSTTLGPPPYISMEKGEVTALTLLDLSAALDTIDQATLTDLQIGMEYLARLKSGFPLISNIGTNQYKLNTLFYLMPIHYTIHIYDLLF